MRQNTKPSLGRTALWIFYGLLAYMPLHVFLSTWLGTSFGLLEAARITKDIVVVAGFGAAVCCSWRQPWFGRLLKDKLVWLVLAYVLLTVGMALVKPTDLDAEILGVVYNLRFLMFFLYAGLLTRLFDPKHVLRRSVQIVLVAGAVVVAFGIIQYVALPNDSLKHLGYERKNGVLPVFLIDEKPDLERVMSTLRDPNSLGSYLIIIAPLAATALFLAKKSRYKLRYAGLLAATVVCTWFTFSRSAWLGLALALMGFIALSDHGFKERLQRHRAVIVIYAVAVVVLMMASLVVFRNSYFVQNVILHSDQSTVLEDPNELRVRFFKESIQDIADHPLGKGPGTAGLTSVRNNIQGTILNENYYLQIATEVGVAGLLLFVAILALVAWRLWRLHVGNPVVQALLASFLGLALTNFLVHIWSNEAVAYTWWGLAGLTGSVVRNSHNKRARGK
ncbi:MAG TPA: O-antigen ligase family protein [Verrucomicrobiae bacterium]|nr:O-antigen ligase family protein [Verrucomicrobiae bacterium]